MNFGWEGVHNSVHNHLPESILQAQEVRGHSLLLLLSQLRVQSPLPISMLVMVVFLFLKKEKWWYRKFIGMNAGSLIKKKSEKGSSRQKKKREQRTGFMAVLLSRVPVLSSEDTGKETWSRSSRSSQSQQQWRESSFAGPDLHKTGKQENVPLDPFPLQESLLGHPWCHPTLCPSATR